MRLRHGFTTQPLDDLLPSLADLFAREGWKYVIGGGRRYRITPGVCRLRAMVARVADGADDRNFVRRSSGRFVVQRTPEGELELLLSLGYLDPRSLSAPSGTSGTSRHP